MNRNQDVLLLETNADSSIPDLYEDYEDEDNLKLEFVNLDIVKSATDHFSMVRKLGEGGLGYFILHLKQL